MRFKIQVSALVNHSICSLYIYPLIKNNAKQKWNYKIKPIMSFCETVKQDITSLQMEMKWLHILLKVRKSNSLFFCFLLTHFSHWFFHHLFISSCVSGSLVNKLQFKQSWGCKNDSAFPEVCSCQLKPLMVQFSPWWNNKGGFYSFLFI